MDITYPHLQYIDLSVRFGMALFFLSLYFYISLCSVCFIIYVGSSVQLSTISSCPLDVQEIACLDNIHSLFLMFMRIY